MVHTSVLVTVVLAAFAILGGAFYALVHVLGQRVSDVGRNVSDVRQSVEDLGAHMRSGFERTDARIDALHDAVAEMGRRITALGARGG
jgi:uncharacterized protein YoxC